MKEFDFCYVLGIYIVITEGLLFQNTEAGVIIINAFQKIKCTHI